MTAADVIRACYLDFLTSPANPRGLSPNPGKALFRAYKHGMIAFEEMLAAVRLIHEMGANPWAHPFMFSVPLDVRWEYIHSFLVFAEFAVRDDPTLGGLPEFLGE